MRLNVNKFLSTFCLEFQSIYTILNNPESYSCCEYNYLTKIFPGKYKIVLYKKQNNVVSQISYTENVVPNVNNYVFNIDW